MNIPIICVLRTYAMELMTPGGNNQDFMYKVVGELIDKIQDQWLP